MALNVTLTGSKADLIADLREQATEAGKLAKANPGKAGEPARQRQLGIQDGLERAITSLERWTDSEASANGSQPHATPYA